MNTDEFKDIHYVQDQHGIVTLTFNTPQRKNALSMYSFFELYLAVDKFENDETAHAMIITGAKDPNSDNPAREAFSSGGYFNPDAFVGVSADIMEQIDQNDIAQKRVTLKLYQCEKPIIAAINGLAIGGAVTLVLACADQIFMSEHAWLQLPFAKLGLSAELASSYLLPQLVGFQKAKEILFFAEKISSQQAFDLQFANKVLPHQELLPYAYDKALKLIPPQGASRSIREMKKLLHEPHIQSLSDALDRENRALRRLFGSSDFTEGLTARVERRPALFTGN